MTYLGWRRPFSPGKERVLFIGLAPPVPKSRKTAERQEELEFRYIYNKPDSEFIENTTAKRLKNTLKEALVKKPDLEKKYPALANYFKEEEPHSLFKRPFLKALCGSGMIWYDCIEFPVNTRLVRGILRNPKFCNSLGNTLGNHDCEVAIFLTPTQQKLNDEFREVSNLRGKYPRTHVLSVNFWNMGPERAGSEIAEVL